MNCPSCEEEGNLILLKNIVMCPNCGKYFNDERFKIMLRLSEEYYENFIKYIELKVKEGKRLSSEELSNIDMNNFVKLIIRSGPIARFKLAKVLFEMFLAESDNNISLVIGIATSALDIATESIKNRQNKVEV